MSTECNYDIVHVRKRMQQLGIDASKPTYDAKKLADFVAKQRLAAKRSLKTLSKQDFERAMSKQIDFSSLYPEEFTAMVKYNFINNNKQ